MAEEDQLVDREEARKRAVDYAERGLPVTAEKRGAIPSDSVLQPGRPAEGIGTFIDRFGNEGAPTIGPSGFPTPAPRGTIGVEGQLSPQEEQFWAANPNGVVKDPDTGMLIGLGDARVPRIMERYSQFGAGIGAPGIPQQPFQQGQQRAPTIDDFIDPAIENRISEIDNERAATMEHLNTASRQRIGGGRRGGGGPSDWEVGYAKLKSLDHARDILQKEQLGRANLKMRIAGQEFNRQRQMDTANQTQGFYDAMANVRSPIGTPEHAQEVLAIAGQFPLAVNTPEIKKVLQEHADLHDSHAQLIANAQAQGKTVTQTGISASGKPTYRVTDPNVVPASVKTRYDRVQADIQMHLEQSAADRQKLIDAKRPGTENLPYKDAARLHASQLEAARIEEQYPALKSTTGQSGATENQQPNMPQIRSDIEFQQLPSGSLFIDPNGVKRRKP